MFFLGIHGGYKEIGVGIFAAQTAGSGAHELQREIIPNANASKQLVFVIARLLEHHNLSLQDLAFIFVNQGPAPFTTLRTVLATVNALSFARHIPLVGLDSLKALAAESTGFCDKNKKSERGEQTITVALLDAFNNDVYYCLKADTPEMGSEYKTGYESIAVLIDRLQKLFENSQKNNRNIKLCLIGNGAQLHRQALEATLQDRIIVPADIPPAASFDFMAQCALEDFNTGQVSSKLSPLYLKLHPAQIAKQKS